MALALNNLKRVDIPLNKETKPNQCWLSSKDLHHLYVDTRCPLEDLPGVMDERDGCWERDSGNTALSMRWRFSFMWTAVWNITLFFHHVTYLCLWFSVYKDGGGYCNSSLSLRYIMCLCSKEIGRKNEKNSLLVESYSSHHHHVAPSAWISLTHSRHPSQSSIAFSKSSGLHLYQYRAAVHSFE